METTKKQTNSSEKVIEFRKLTKEEYFAIKQDIQNRFKFARIKRNNQQYAYGGFNLSPRDYENGFTTKQIDSLCIFLKSCNIDDESLSIQGEEIYGKEHGEFSGTKIKYLTLKNGFSFLMRLIK